MQKQKDTGKGQCLLKMYFGEFSQKNQKLFENNDASGIQCFKIFVFRQKSIFYSVL